MPDQLSTASVILTEVVDSKKQVKPFLAKFREEQRNSIHKYWTKKCSCILTKNKKRYMINVSSCTKRYLKKGESKKVKGKVSGRKNVKKEDER